MHHIIEMRNTVVMGLCCTKEWKKALSLPNLSNIGTSLNILIRKSIREDELNIAWDLVEKLAKSHEYLSASTIRSFIKYYSKHKQDLKQNIHRLLSICERIELLFDEPTIHELISLLKNSGCQAEITKIHLR